MKAVKNTPKPKCDAKSRAIWEKPWPYLAGAALFGLLGVASYSASQRQWLLWYGGMAAYNGSIWCAVLLGLSVILAVSRSLRIWVVSILTATFPPHENEQRVQYDNFDSLRLILALSVAFFHAHNAVAPKFAGLFASVPCFLAISGFLVLQSFEYSANWLHFARKRLLRVGPAFIACLPFTALLMGAPAVWATLRTWITLGLGSDIYNSGDGVVWSLSCEEVCYAALAIIFLLGGYRRPAVVWLLFAVSVAFAVQNIASASILQQNVLVLPPAFFTGNLAYLYRHKLRALPKWIPLTAFAVGVIGFFVRGDNIVVQFYHQVVFIATFVWCAAFGPKLLPRLRTDLSYGIYIYHIPILRWLVSSHLVKGWVLIPVEIAAVVLVALVSWHAMEKRAIAWGRRTKSPTQKPLSTAATTRIAS